MGRSTCRRLPLATCVALLAACVRVAEPGDAEFAVRWDPAEGGPSTAAAVTRLLELRPGREESFEVRYYDAPTPASAPDSARVILRERSRDGGKTELVVKYRRAAPVTGKWTCPLGQRADRTAQVDIGFGPGGSVSRMYSYSCEVSADSFPASLHASPRACSISIARVTTDHLKIETWPLPNGEQLLEVSREARDSQSDLAGFEAIVNRLIAAGAHPIAESKTALAGTCR